MPLLHLKPRLIAHAMAMSTAALLDRVTVVPLTCDFFAYEAARVWLIVG